MVQTEEARQIVEEFLSYPLNRADRVFARFEGIPGVITGRGEHPLERYACIPGSRENKIVLVAHADTVWDDAYGHPAETSVVFQDGIFRGTNPDCGIGADDRGGCAMLWALQDCGHTLLLLNGEEKGKLGAKYLRKSNPKLFRWLNRHSYMIELDWKGTNSCLFNQVDNTKRFKKFITAELGFLDSKARGGTDLEILCKRICGVNLGVGYAAWHTDKEHLVLADWENTYRRLHAFLKKPQPRFSTQPFLKYIRFAKCCIRKILTVLRIKPKTC